ncbi:MAG: HEAT repeat domain-containing protein [Candidatus Zixiibacteriota bacterium]
MKKVIGAASLVVIFHVVLSLPAAAQRPPQNRVDSLFLIASSGEVKFREMVQPAIDSLAAMGAEAMPVLVAKLNTKSARDRVTLMQIVKKMGKPATPFLVTALKQADGLAVERACMGLGEVLDSAAVPALNDITAHKRWQVREQALGALGKIKDSRAEDVVVQRLSDSIGLVRKSAAVACGQLRMNGAIHMLVHMLGDDFYGARLSAAAALCSLDTATVVQAVVDSLESPNPQAGNLGCELLGKLGTEPAQEALLYQTQAKDPSRRAHAALGLLQADPSDRCGYQETYFMLESDRLVRLKIESAIANRSHGRP